LQFRKNLAVNRIEFGRWHYCYPLARDFAILSDNARNTQFYFASAQYMEY